MDVRTLVFAFLLVQSCCAGALLLIARGLPGLRVLRWFGWAFASVAGCLALVLVSATNPLMVLGARLLVLTGAVLLAQGTVEFVVPAANVLRWGMVLLALYGVAQAALLAAHNASGGIILSCAVEAAELLFAALVLLSHAEPAERVATRTTAATLIGIGGLTMLRALVLPSRSAVLQANLLANDRLRFWGTVAYFLLDIGTVFGVIWMATARLRSQLELQASTDALTGVLNRRAIASLGQRAVSDCSARGASLAVLAIDLDHFKRLNDTYGHAAGDAVLCASARLLSQGLRSADLVARIGGEEFVVVLPERDAGRAFQIAERLRHHFEILAIEHEGQSMQVTASIGIAVLAGAGADGAAPMRGAGHAWNDLLARADAWLYRAKQAGRNCTRGETAAVRAGEESARPGLRAATQAAGSGVAGGAGAAEG